MQYNLNINSYTNKEEISKQLILIKAPAKDGLFLQVHNTIQKGRIKQTTRFIHVCFDKQGNILVASDHTGNIILIDLNRDKFWVLPAINSCTVLKFSAHNCGEIIVGVQTGALYIVNIDTGDITGELLCHNYPVVEISFSHPHICLTASKKEAVVWDLRSNSKIQVLSLLENCILKHVLFTPVVGDILACFDDNSIVVWKYGTYEVSKEIHSKSLHSIKSITFTRNGRAMVLADHQPQLTVFMMDTWAIRDTLALPDYITSIRKITFLPQVFDGGANKILGILSGGGVLYFYNMETEEIINKISTNAEITKFDCSVDGKYVSCLLHSGELYLYSGIQYTKTKARISTTTVAQRAPKKRESVIRKKLSELANVQKQMNEYLAIDRLVAILKEFGEYPDSYRSKIWAQLLQLPNNKKQYNNFINHGSSTPFENLHLDNKLALLSLKKLLSNITSWCPHFAHVTYMPVFVFPFMKIFQKEPIICFEAVCSIILNWCQYWFEYFPLPPINILAMIENIIFEQDVELLNHLTSNDVTSKLYAWPLFEAAFSEVVNEVHWRKLWDHILSNEPAFLIVCVAAYSLYNRQTLVTMNKKSDFEHFYHNPNTFDVKKFISKTYTLMNSISEKNHPRRFLHSFRCLPIDSYPSFAGFPKNLVNFNFDQVQELRNEQQKIDQEREVILSHRQMLVKSKEIDERERIEEERLKEMEMACQNKIREETERIKEKRDHVNELRRQLQLEEIELLNKSRQQILEKSSKQRQQELEQIMGNVEQTCATEEVELAKAESDLVKRYSELLHHKIKLENSLQSTDVSNEHYVLKLHQEKLVKVLELLKNNSSGQYMKDIALATGISAMDDLILKIERELANSDDNKHSATKVLELESETKQLEYEVSKLLLVLADVKSREGKQRHHKLYDNIYSRKQLSKERPCASSISDDFAKLREMIQEAYQSSENESLGNVSEELADINLEME
ncbi:hypothetical protein RI129_003885 [Pyrocoelia pectoralis]|uniref:Rab-GAP TBC domain-containing protein n=1 Tax=Pyrocoelia pectoralis TaxID=417401 RepID=A0AAN7VRN8_9COLE